MNYSDENRKFTVEDLKAHVQNEIEVAQKKLPNATAMASSYLSDLGGMDIHADTHISNSISRRQSLEKTLERGQQAMEILGGMSDEKTVELEFCYSSMYPSADTVGPSARVVFWHGEEQKREKSRKLKVVSPV